ncbi:energy-dependent translational throttle protein EttA [Humibacter albus]|uniref:energy-dependent translational throttle protein EttA n=1 Tax=Humibacter albus TaxID=427754 RepID=UPI000527B71D|nr:energy-dependent translational throttle protein EttA [Humibacter albus]
MAATQWCFQLSHVRVAKGERVILDDVSLTFLPGAKIGVVGPNGAGKSTLLRVIAGMETPSAGEATAAPGVSVGILLQEPPLDDTTTVLGNVQEAVSETTSMLKRFNEIAQQLATDFSEDLLTEMGELQHELDHRDAWDLDSRLEQAMAALDCPPPETPVADLSGGERRRVALCALLLRQPDLLLLDEPTNHLDADSTAWLEQHLAAYPGTVIAVTHDRYFLDNVAQWILELDRGRAFAYEGNYTTYLQTKQDRMAVEGKKDEKRRRRIREELAWVRAGTKGRQRMSAARLSRYEEMVTEAERTRKLDFDEIQIPPGPRLGTLVIDAAHVTKGFDGRMLIDDLSFSLPRNGIVGVLGPNGVGKTTLFEMMAGRQHPDSGEFVIGDSVRISYVDQARAGIGSDQSAWQAVSDGQDMIAVGKVEIPSRAYIAAFGFKGAAQQKPVRLFSGGERNRLNLALTLKDGGNVLLLDEPTNDLDTETSASLEAALLEFPGCAIVTAHDRWFLDRVATHILAWEGTEQDPARWHWFEGDFEGYEADRAARLGPEATRPSRGVHRRLARG